MWLAGDAEQQEISWFDATDYDKSPGMRATVLKGDHHGRLRWYLGAVSRSRAARGVVVLSLQAANDYGYVHSQTLGLLRSQRIPWYRTDQNGTITITVPPHAKYSVSAERGGPNMRGPSDRPARHCGEDESAARRR
jgi:beta-lactamase superfamily II metal-dependent hydrolase